MREVTVNTVASDLFPVYEPDGYTRHSGLLNAGFTATVFRNGVLVSPTVTVAEIGSTGTYLASFTPTAVGFYDLHVLVDYNKAIYETQFEVVTLLTNATISSISTNLTRALGLLHHNAIVDNQVYDVDGQMTSARMRVFDSAVNVPATPGGSESTGLVHEYTVQATYVGQNVLNKFTLRQVT